ncbi:MAG: DNA-protecting protein DprA [Lewinellaceae bacterium]|nr:DNA-protecting protein DprA [Lewinellaceae bacterium]
MDDLLYKIALTLIPQVGPVTARNLVSYCGGARAVFEANGRELQKIPGIGPAIARNILSREALERAEQEIAFLEEHQIQALFYLDDAYPRRLRNFPDSPPILYYKGQANLNTERIAGIVGTRRPTPQGIRACEEMVEGLLPYGVTIVSGLAYGVDITAHRKCLELDVPTVGVLGHGLQQVYPPQHLSVARAMVHSGGLLSEYPSHTQPDREHFPMRNRIIAGLCDALIVVETQRRGGSMITAQMANEYNKDVFAIPGRVKDPYSEGCNNLIKTHRAALVESAADVAYLMRWDELDSTRAVQQQLFVELSEEEKIVVDLLSSGSGESIDFLATASGKLNSELAGILLELEFKGLIRALPGKRFILV